MTGGPAPRPFTPRRAKREAILVVGLVGTFLVVMGGIWSLASRVWSTSFTQTLEVMVAAPFLAAWVLAPLFWAVRPGARRTDGQDETPTSLIIAITTVALGATGYGVEFVLRPWWTDTRLGASAVYAVLLVPCAQWAALVIGGVLESRDPKSAEGSGGS